MKKILLNTFIVLFCVGIIAYVYEISPKTPSNDRLWSQDQAILSDIQITDNLVHISNVRNFEYSSTTIYTPNYYDATYDISKLKQVWYIVEPFSRYKGAAHTFLSFEFEDNTFLAVSVEIRKEQGESFDAKKGLLREYELMYVFADERDVINLRANHRKNIVYVYPVQTSPEKTQALFKDILYRAQKLHTEPEFYNTFTNNCTTNIIKHVNTISPQTIPLTYAAVFPEYSDIVAHRLKLIPHDKPIEEVRAQYQVNEKAELYQNDPAFSVRIRE